MTREDYINSIRGMTLKDIAVKYCKEHHLPKILSVVLLKFSYPLLIEKDKEYNELKRQNEELEKVNAELKADNDARKFAMAMSEKVEKQLREENAKLKDEWQEQVQKATDEGYARTLQTMQLTKAKELLKKLLSAYTSYADSFDDRDNEIIAETEQFLSEVEK